MTPYLLGGLGASELAIIFAIIILIFGASKLPELARGSGRALHIFKAETKGLSCDTPGSGKPVDLRSAEPVDRT